MNTTHSVALVDSASNMTSRGSASAGSNEKSTVTADTQPSPGFFKRYGLVFAVAALGIICLMPQLADLSIAGQRMIGIMAFAVITWATGRFRFPPASSWRSLRSLWDFLRSPTARDSSARAKRFAWR